MTLVPVRDAARGRWRGVLAALGVEDRYLTGRNTSCPICGKGKDCFRFTDHNHDGVWLCSKCDQAGDGIKLLMVLRGWDFRTAAQEVEGVLGVVKDQPPKPDKSEEAKRADMTALWRSASAPKSDDAVGWWLRNRVGVTTIPPVIRIGSHPKWTSSRPAMLAKVQDHDERPVQIHRTFLTSEGLKADVSEPRMVMPGTMPKGSAVRLFPVVETLGIAEGIETAFAAASLFATPCWAALNAGNLEAWSPPPEVRRVIVYGDCDASFHGQLAAYALARRLRRGELEVEVRIPDTIGHDWNDVLMATRSCRETA